MTICLWKGVLLSLLWTSLAAASSTALHQQSLTAQTGNFHLDQPQAAPVTAIPLLTSSEEVETLPGLPNDDDEIREITRDFRQQNRDWDDYYEDAQNDVTIVVNSTPSLLETSQDIDEFPNAQMPQEAPEETFSITPAMRTEVLNIPAVYDQDEYSDERFYYAFAQVGQTLDMTQYPVYEREDWDDVEEYIAPFTSIAMLGDMDDNDETDLWPLTQTSPVISVFQPDNPTYNYRDFRDAIDDDDSDEVEKTNLLQQAQVTDGTIAAPLLEDAETEQTVTSPLARDTDDLPDDVDDDGDDPSDGDLQFLLVTSFTDDATGSGKVWVIPKDSDDREKGFVLVGGLQRPVGVCFDVNNEFLYVVDLTSESSGSIYQYEIDWDDDDKFELKKPEYTVVYEGSSPYDCTVDEYGNLFFVDPAANQVNMINYLDLWSGFLNQQVVLYSGVDDLVVSRPVAIEAYEKKRVYWLNSENGNSNGLLITAPGRSEFMTERRPSASVRDDREPFGLAVSDDYVYYTLADGSVWAYDREDKDKVYEKASGIAQPRGACYGDDHVYVADHGTGTIYRLDDDNDSETPSPFIRVQGAYNVHCVNAAIQVALAAAMLFGLI